MDALFSESQTAISLNIKLDTLRRWRAQGRGPAHVRLGRLVKYRAEDVARFIDAKTVSVPAEPNRAA